MRFTGRESPLCLGADPDFPDPNFSPKFGSETGMADFSVRDCHDLQPLASAIICRRSSDEEDRFGG